MPRGPRGSAPGVGYDPAGHGLGRYQREALPAPVATGGNAGDEQEVAAGDDGRCVVTVAEERHGLVDAELSDPRAESASVLGRARVDSPHEGQSDVSQAVQEVRGDRQHLQVALDRMKGTHHGDDQSLGRPPDQGEDVSPGGPSVGPGIRNRVVDHPDPGGEGWPEAGHDGLAHPDDPGRPIMRVRGPSQEKSCLTQIIRAALPTVASAQTNAAFTPFAWTTVAPRRRNSRRRDQPAFLSPTRVVTSGGRGEPVRWPSVARPAGHPPDTPPRRSMPARAPEGAWTGSARSPLLGVGRNEDDGDRAHRLGPKTSIAPSRTPRAPRQSRFARRCRNSIRTRSPNCARATGVCGKFFRNR
jgi:hypothetical protein